MAGLSVIAVSGITPAQAFFWDSDFGYRPARYKSNVQAKLSPAKRARKADTPADKSALPAGPLQIIVSIKDQRVTLYANGAEVARAPVSTGTPSHPTPMGLFTIIQKDRHHVSNLYDAAMPYMQRITWSGSAMHQGPLPGYPASHGCIRLPTDFAAMLWKATKIGVRVVIAREEAKPVEIEHAQLFVPKPKLVAAAPQPVKTADGADLVPGAVVPDTAPQPSTAAITPAPQVKPLQDQKAVLVEAIPSARDVQRRVNPVSVFVSLKDKRLYVRQAMEPVFDMPITVRNPDAPIGTHVYTAMELKADAAAMRWTSISIPSSYPRPVHAPGKTKGKSKVVAAPVAAPAAEPQPVSSAKDALDRLELTQDMRDQIGAMLTPGSSLIISDNSINNGETGKHTDFIVLTR